MSAVELVQVGVDENGGALCVAISIKTDAVFADFSNVMLADANVIRSDADVMLADENVMLNDTEVSYIGREEETTTGQTQNIIHLQTHIAQNRTNTYATDVNSIPFSGAKRKRSNKPLPKSPAEFSSDSSSSSTSIYKCADCGHVTKTSGGMTIHLRTHSNERPFVCSFEGCIKAFKTSTDFARHKRTHTGERPYSCGFEGCDLSFKTNAQRTVHSRLHTGEKPYVCQECGKTSSSLANFKSHMRIHTGEKPYACRVEGCRKSYTDHSGLMRHIASHSTERSYPCSMCNKTYKQIASLRHHERQAHGRRLRVKDKGLTPAEEASIDGNFPDERTDVTLSARVSDTLAPVTDIAETEERSKIDRDIRVSVVIVDRDPAASFTCLSQNLS